MDIVAWPIEEESADVQTNDHLRSIDKSQHLVSDLGARGLDYRQRERNINSRPMSLCIEFIAKRGPFYAKRLGDLITVYYSSENDEVVGLLIKAVKSLLSEYRGSAIDIREGRIPIVHIIRARAWQEDDPDHVYTELFDIAGNTEAELELTRS